MITKFVCRTLGKMAGGRGGGLDTCWDDYICMYVNLQYVKGVGKLRRYVTCNMYVHCILYNHLCRFKYKNLNSTF